jgi:acetoin utilization deacetylase AcuC-like enzyme
MTEKILTYITPHHAQHAPQIEFMHGKIVPYFELPERIDSLLQGVEQAGMVAMEEPALQITDEVLTRAHDPAMIAHLQHISAHGTAIIRKSFGMYHMDDELGDDEYYYTSTFPRRYYGGRDGKPQYFVADTVSPIGKGTWNAILHSANLAYAGAQALVEGEQRVYTVCRPPGHHAGRDFAGGYCYLNNAAIAAQTLLEHYERVAIVDVDYHHGNGTQDIFWNESRLFFVSIHGAPAVEYPYYSGYADETGAAGQILNIPLPHGTSEAVYLQELENSLGRVRAFQPQALVVSLGFDTYTHDPIADFHVDMPGYKRMGQLLASFHLPTLYVQEGGYCVDKLGEMATAFFGGVLGM